MGEDSHCQEEIFQGRESRGCSRSPGAEIYPESIPLSCSCFHSFFLSSASECAESASGPSFFYSLSFFFIFSHSPWQLQGGGGRRTQQLFVCMGPLYSSFVSQGLSVYITGYHLARHLVPSMLFKCFLDDIINAYGWEECQDLTSSPSLPSNLTLRHSRAMLPSSLADSFGFALQSFPCTRCKAGGVCISAEVAV